MNQPKSEIKKIKYIAHRGFSKLAPENTIPAYQVAGEYNFWGAETDIHTTQDGQWICMHDSTVDRTTNGRGKINEVTLEQINMMSIDSGNNINKYPNLKVPTFEEYLNCCIENKLYPIIEIKRAKSQEEYDSFMAIVRKYKIEKECVVISFDYDALEEIRKRSRYIYIQFLAEITEENILRVKSLGNAGFDCEYVTLTKELIDRVHEEGIMVNCWTVDEYNDARKLVDMGIDMITTNTLGGELK